MRGWVFFGMVRVRRRTLHAYRPAILLDAFAAHPERFANSVPQPPALPLAVWINKPKDAQDDLVTAGKGVVAP